AAAVGGAGGAAQAILVGAGGVPVDRDDRHLPQDQPVRRRRRGAGQGRPDRGAVAALPGLLAADLVDVPHAGAQARRPADRRAGAGGREDRQVDAPLDQLRPPPSRTGRRIMTPEFQFFPSRTLSWYMAKAFLVRSAAVLLA